MKKKFKKIFISSCLGISLITAVGFAITSCASAATSDSNNKEAQDVKYIVDPQNIVKPYEGYNSDLSQKYDNSFDPNDITSVKIIDAYNFWALFYYFHDEMFPKDNYPEDNFESVFKDYSSSFTTLLDLFKNHHFLDLSKFTGVKAIGDYTFALGLGDIFGTRGISYKSEFDKNYWWYRDYYNQDSLLDNADFFGIPQWLWNALYESSKKNSGAIVDGKLSSLWSKRMYDDADAKPDYSLTLNSLYSINNISLPPNVEEIGTAAFFGLKAVIRNISYEKLKYIGESAFAGSFLPVPIPLPLDSELKESKRDEGTNNRTWGSRSFINNVTDQKILYGVGNNYEQYFYESDLSKYKFLNNTPESFQKLEINYPEIKKNSFYGGNFKEIKIGNNVKKIDKNALALGFLYNREIKIPKNVEFIDPQAFGPFINYQFVGRADQDTNIYIEPGSELETDILDLYKDEPIILENHFLNINLMTNYNKENITNGLSLNNSSIDFYGDIEIPLTFFKDKNSKTVNTKFFLKPITYYRRIDSYANDFFNVTLKGGNGQYFVYKRYLDKDQIKDIGNFLPLINNSRTKDGWLLRRNKYNNFYKEDYGFYFVDYLDIDKKESIENFAKKADFDKYYFTKKSDKALPIIYFDYPTSLDEISKIYNYNKIKNIKCNYTFINGDVPLSDLQRGLVYLGYFYNIYQNNGKVILKWDDKNTHKTMQTIV